MNKKSILFFSTVVYFFIIVILSFPNTTYSITNVGDLKQGKYTATIENFAGSGNKQVFEFYIQSDYGGDLYFDEKRSTIPIKDSENAYLYPEDNLTFIHESGSGSVEIDLTSRERIGDGVTGEIKTDGAGNLKTKTVTAVSATKKPAKPIGGWDGTYTLMGKLGGLFGDTVNITEDGISSYLDALFRAGIAIATGLALIMVMYGGFLYTSTDAITGKGEGKEIIKQALLGLLLALTSVLILTQLNPALLRNDVRPNEVFVPGIGDVDVYQGCVPTPTQSCDPKPGTPGSGGTWDENGNYTGALIPGTNKFRLSNFTNPETQSYVNSLIEKYGLNNMSPTDAARFFPNGVVTTEGWNSIIAGMVKLESGFKPDTLYWETSMSKYSVGLLQLSTDDAEVKRRGYSQADLQDPYKNLDVGIEILARQIRNDGCISCRQPGGWRGASAYWSTIR